jgi:hypothetical protein
VWDYDQRFNILLDRLTFQIQDVQHREWFIAGFASPYLSPTYPTEGDYSGRSNGDCDALGGYTRRRRDIDRFGTGTVSAGQPNDAIARYGKGKFMHEHVWCTMCRSEGHRRDECPTLGNYMETGALNPFPVGPQTEWCKFAGSGAIYHPTSQHWRNIRRHIILHSVNSASPWDMM